MNPLLILTIGLLIGFPAAWKFIPYVLFFEWALFHFYSAEIRLKLLNLIEWIQDELDKQQEEKQSKKINKIK